MKYSYTRQRQGRDFIDQSYLRENEAKKSMLERINQFKAEQERNSTPIDGHDPKPERGRDLI
jgi:hypothetical protein